MGSRGIVAGVGINDADYVVQKNENIVLNGKTKTKVVWRCPYYRVWCNMITRCYNKNSKLKYPSYKDCYVCDEWLTFSNFKSWMGQQDWEGKELDKDILFKGNKVYSPDTCIFVSRKLNTLLISSSPTRGKYPLGVSYHKRDCNYHVRCCLDGKITHCGVFDNPEDAHKVWQQNKIKDLKLYIEKYKDVLDERLISCIQSRAEDIQDDIENSRETVMV